MFAGHSSPLSSTVPAAVRFPRTCPVRGLFLAGCEGLNQVSSPRSGGAVLVVPVPDADAGGSPQGVPWVEGPAEGLMGGSAEGDREAEELVEDPVEDPGSPCQWEA